jgi:2,5-diketo-D-gluconate reductase B
MDELSPVGLGTMGIGDPDVIETALDVGYCHLDTAQIYRNENAVGDGIAQAGLDRDEVFLATKVWADSLAPDDVHETTAESLERLNADYADLLYVHRPVDTYHPERTLGAFDELVVEGKTRRVGVSNFTVSQIEKATDVLDTPLFAHQTEYHPLFQRPELLAHARKHDYWLVAYSPLAGGKAGDIEEVAAIARKHDTTPEAVCIAWLAGEENVHPIPKASSREHMVANLEAAALELDAEDIERIESIEREEELFPE